MSSAASTIDPVARLLRRLRPWQIATGFALLLYLPWLGGRSLWFPDEPDVAEPAIEMLRSGDWVVPRQNGEPWLDYPPLTYWLGAVSGTLAGATRPFALRLPVALLAALLAGLTAWATERLAGRRAGLWAGLTLVTAPHFAYQAVNYHPDMAFATLIASGIALYAWGVLESRGRWRAVHQIGGFLCFGGAVLAKGPLGLLLPGLVLVVWHLSARRWRAVLWLAPLSLVSLAVVLPWYGLVVRALSWEYVSNEVYLQNFARFGAAGRGHGESWWYYLGRIWFDWAPWSLLLPGALAAALRRGWKAPWIRLAVLWAVVPLLFFSLAATKREVYLLPAYPAMAFLLGRHLASLVEQQGASRLRWWARVVGALCLAASAGLLAVVVGRESLAPRLDGPAVELLGETAAALGTLCAVLAVGGVLLLSWAHRGLAARAPAAIALGLGLTYALTLAAIVPRVDRFNSYGEVTRSLRQAAGDERLGFYRPGIKLKRAGFRVEDPAFQPLRLLETPEEVAEYLSRPSRIVIADPELAPEIAAAVPGWRRLPKRELTIGDSRFLIVGPPGEELHG